MQTKEKELFDSDAVLNKLYDVTKSEIPWNYKPDGHRVFVEWLAHEISRARREGRREGLKEMDEAWQFTCFNSTDEDMKRNPVETLRQEYSNQP